MSHPLLYQVNTRCWLNALSRRHGNAVTLATVPDAELAGWRSLGFTHIWLMGVWTTGPRSRAEALRHAGLRKAYDDALPGWSDADVSGSPYAIGDYEVPEKLGGDTGLAEFRQRLHAHGLKLVLDFVPNHVGLDHPWARERPELFVQSPEEAPGTFRQATATGSRWLAHGRDPYFEPWTDTIQLDYRRAETRAAMTELLQSISRRCDGVRCDMAMLVLNEVFLKTWGRLPASGTLPSSEFWASVIPAVRQGVPGFLFLAEAYWGLETHLRALGFDYTYDKSLYDALIARDGAGAQHHLLGLRAEALAGGAHFLENHDERRVASVLPPAEHRAAALVILGLPGMRFLHEGQLVGACRKLPVQLNRRLEEPAQPEIARIYDQFLNTLPRTAAGRGRGELLRPRLAWPDNPTAQNFIIVQWQQRPPEFDLVVVNVAGHRSQCYAPLTVPHLPAHNWSMKDEVGPEEYKRAGDDLQNQGLYLDLPPHGAQLFHFAPTA